MSRDPFLQAALEEANIRGAIPGRGDLRRLERMVDNAIRQLDRGNHNAALRHVRNFIRFTERTDFVGGDNDLGEFLMRGSNLEFMLAEKIIPLAP